MREPDTPYQLVASASQWDRLMHHLAAPDAERMAFGYCTASRSARGVRLLLRDVALPGDHEYATQHSAGVVLDAVGTIPYLLRAKGAAALLDAHSHPWSEVPHPSRTDDAAAPPQYRSLQAVAPGGALLRIVLTRQGEIWAGILTSETRRETILQEVRVHGPEGVRIIHPVNTPAPTCPAVRAIDSRNLAMLGAANLARVRRLHIAVIGLGGVGSMVARLTAGLAARLILIDPDRLEPSNAPRLWYAGAASRGPKVVAAKRALERAFPDLTVTARVAAFPSPETTSLVQEADAVFACPDHNAVRVSASRLAADGMLPLIEVGCGGRREGGSLSALGYHVRLQIPDGPCLVCSGLDTSRLEDPESTREKRSLGYVDNAGEVAGELGCLTTRAAADAVDVLLRYWTGYAGPPPLHLYVDALRFKTLDLSRAFASREDCPVCGASSGRWPNKTEVVILRPLAGSRTRGREGRVSCYTGPESAFPDPSGGNRAPAGIAKRTPRTRCD